MRNVLVPCLLLVVALIVIVPGDLLFADPSSDSNGALQVLVKSRGPMTSDAIAAISGHGARVAYVWPEINALAMSVPPSKMGELAADPFVAVVEADQQGSVEGGDGQAAAATTPPSTVVPLFTSTTPLLTWNLSMARTAGSGFDGSGVTVAVVDSGLPQNWEEFLPAGSVDLEHAAGFGAEGWGDFHNPVKAIRGVGGHIELFPHGLAVSSLIVGFPSDFGPVGGAAPGATILPVRVINQFNFGWFSWFTAGILHVAHLKATGALPGPVVINFSIQATGDSTVLMDAIDYAIAQGIVFVTIAGNFGPDPGSIAFPGRLPEAITAGAVGWVSQFATPEWFFESVPPDDPLQIYLAAFSGREFPGDPPASRVDVLAPGSFVFGEWLSGPGFSEGREVAFDAVDNYIFGTSFACPHVVGIAAQMLQKNPSLTQTQVESILRGTALPIPPGLWDPAGTGRGLVRGVVAVSATP
jgi:subtilisin family serine protease